jgi:hypothetical protein
MLVCRGTQGKVKRWGEGREGSGQGAKKERERHDLMPFSGRLYIELSVTRILLYRAQRTPPSAVGCLSLSSMCRSNIRWCLPKCGSEQRFSIQTSTSRYANHSTRLARAFRAVPEALIWEYARCCQDRFLLLHPPHVTLLCAPHNIAVY